MKPRKPISRLTNLRILRQVDRALLRRLLSHEKFAQYVKDRGIGLPPETKKRGDYDFKPLAAALLDDENRPEELVDALESIGVMSDGQGVEALHRAARELGAEELLSSAKIDADFAIKAYLDAAQVFYSALNDKKAVDTRRYRCFTLAEGRSADPSKLSPDNIKGMGERLSSWFEKNRRGAGSEILSGDERDGTRWFVVSHGGTKRREATFEDKEKKHVEYRPENGDVIRLRRSGNEMWVHSATLAEAQEYLKAFGQLLCGSETAYVRARDYFTLEPLRGRGRKALEVADIEGCPIARIGLREIQVVTAKKNGGRWIVRANNDAFAEIERVGGIPATGEICAAKFDVYFAGATRPVAVKVALPAEACYERDGQSIWVDLWLQRQGFVRAAHAPAVAPPPQEIPPDVENAA